MVVKPRLAIVASHPIQYQVPLFKALSNVADPIVFYANRQTPAQQAQAGYGVAFDWDINLLNGYEYEFLRNRAKRPNVSAFHGCDTPDIAQTLETGRFDAVITMGWYLKSYIQTLNACNRLGIPIMVRGDSSLNTRAHSLKRLIKSVFYPSFLRRFDAFLVVGQKARCYLEHFGVAEDRMFWSPHAVDNERFSKQASATLSNRQELRRSLGCRPGEFMVLFVGRFVSSKRPLDLVKALASLRREGFPARGVFVGDGELRREIEMLGMELSAPLTMTGFSNQSALPAIYAAADALVLPSSQETWGLVVNEAMACGTPAIVSNSVGCAEDLIESGKTGSRYPVGDIASLAHSIKALAPVAGSACVIRALRQKISKYSLEVAVEGILEAVCDGHKH